MARLYGINDKKYPARSDGKTVKEYAVWSAMVQRCYNPLTIAVSPSYAGCEVSEYFMHYSNYYEWWHRTPFSDLLDYSVDKDILGTGKLYSEDVCCFVPREINNLFILRDADRGEYPLGVTRAKSCKSRFIALLNTGKTQTYLGIYKTPQEAYSVYKEAKESRVKEIATKWRDHIEPRVYEALMNYKLKEE